MKRLALKVLLKFLSSYSCWNLVKKANCYHLFFLTHEDGGNSKKGEVLKLGGGGSGVASSFKQTKAKRRGNKLVRRREENAGKCVKSGNGEKTGKEPAFVFSPIFENVEKSIKVGIEGFGLDEKSVLGSIIDDNSKRSSFDSLCWDDFLPTYKKDDDDDDDSYTTLENSTDVDSKESTPLIFDEGEGLEVEIDDETEEICVQVEGDKLLDDMVQLRKDIEHLKDFEDGKETPENRLFDEEVSQDVGPESDDEESLRQTLEIMTLEIKKEIDEKQKDNCEVYEEVSQTNQSRKVMRNFFEKIASGKNVNGTDKLLCVEETIEMPQQGEEQHKLDNTVRDDTIFTVDSEDVSELKIDSKDLNDGWKFSPTPPPFVRRSVIPISAISPKAHLGSTNELKEKSVFPVDPKDKPDLTVDLEDELSLPVDSLDLSVFIVDIENESVLPVDPEDMSVLLADPKDKIVLPFDPKDMSVLVDDSKDKTVLPSDQTHIKTESKEILSIPPPYCSNQNNKGETNDLTDRDTNAVKSDLEAVEASPENIKINESNEEFTYSTNNPEPILPQGKIENKKDSSDKKQTKNEGSKSIRKGRLKKNCTKKKDIIEEMTNDALEEVNTVEGVNTIMAPAEKMVSKDVLRELLEVKKEKQGKDPILDTMISIMNVASTHLSLPAPPNNGVQFRDLFDFEVNLTESHEVFEKLVMNKFSSNDITIQELFPWTNSSTYDKLRGFLID